MSVIQKLSIAQVLNNVLSQGIETEVNQLRDIANNAIGAREVARSFINQHLADMPVLIEGDFFVTFTDDRDQTQTKAQSKSHALWVVALQTTIEIGHTSYDLLAAVYKQWAKDCLNKDWSKEQCKGLAKQFVKAMQDLRILSTKLDKLEYRDAEGVTREGVVVKLSESFIEMMSHETHALREKSSMKCRPLKNQPLDWTSTVEGIGSNANMKLIKGQNFKGTKMDSRVLSAVNKLQGVAYKISQHMVDVAYDLLDNQHEYDSTEEDLRMYREIITMDTSVPYFFPVTMDTRGRMYYRGGLLTPQGTDFCKAAFQFANFVRLGEDGFRALCLHTANMFGKDKVSIDERVQWVEENWQLLMSIEDHIDLQEKFKGANVYQALVAAKELQRLASLTGEWSERASNLVCHQDGTCNGLQHMAAITKNRQTAVTVNCVASSHSDQPLDVYGIIADFAASVATGAAKDVMVKYGRDMAKNPVMITGYGAGKETIIANTMKYLKAHGEDELLGADIGNHYIAAITQHAGAVKALTESIKSRIGQARNAGMEKFTWVTADGFVACTEYRDIECNRIRAGVFNALVPTMFPTPLDDVKTVGAMAPNFIHSIDAAHLRMVVNECDHDLVSVHDSIGSHAGTYFKTAKSIREQFVRVHEYDALGNLCENMGVRAPKFRGDYSASEALQSSYIFS